MLKRWWWVFLVMVPIGPVLGLLTAAALSYPPPLMELDLENEFADRAYPILASLVTPRPIALVTPPCATERKLCCPPRHPYSQNDST
ncbi:MAG: hypothetical protein WCK77_07610 [Verrucomicrobiota bacterium]